MARPGLTGHRKFRRLARALNSLMLARGALELIWEHCYETGDAYLGTAQDIEALVGWDGAQGLLTQALVDAGRPEGVGFIEPATRPSSDQLMLTSESHQGYAVHDLWHHAPDYVKRRRERELDRRQKTAPNEPRRRTAVNGGCRSPSHDRLPGVDRTPSPAPSPAPSPGAQNVSQEPSSGSRQSNGLAPIGNHLEFPVVGEGGPTWLLSDDLIREFMQLYPTVNVRQESLSALGWVRANPGRRKTASGMRRFLNAWLTKATNDGRRGPASPSKLADNGLTHRTNDVRAGLGRTAR
jgi:hypothetical protein